MGYGFKTHLKFSGFQSTILGLTLAPSVMYFLTLEVLNFVGYFMMNVGCILGGSDLKEIQLRAMNRMAENIIRKSRGDRYPDDTNKH